MRGNAKRLNIYWSNGQICIWRKIFNSCCASFGIPRKKFLFRFDSKWHSRTRLSCCNAVACSDRWLTLIQSNYKWPSCKMLINKMNVNLFSHSLTFPIECHEIYWFKVLDLFGWYSRVVLPYLLRLSLWFSRFFIPTNLRLHSHNENCCT